MNDKIWTVEDAAKILETSIKNVYNRARNRGITTHRGTPRNHDGKGYTKGLALLYSDEDIESMKVDKRLK